jgi:tetratricopeptide (TPR) repeat protein
MKPNSKLLILLFFIPGLYAQNRNDTNLNRFLQEGRFADARTLIRRMTDEGEKSEQHLFLRALLSVNADSASVLYERLIDTYPQGVYCDDALFRLAQLKYAQGLYRTSLSSFSHVIEDYPESSLQSKCYYYIGLCYQAMGILDTASIYFQMTGENSKTPDIADLAENELRRLQREALEQSNSNQLNASPKYSVQVGAFSNQTNALLNKAFYEKEGYHVHLRTKMKNDLQMYLVWLESFETWEEARKFGEILLRKYDIEKYIIVSDRPDS